MKHVKPARIQLYEKVVCQSVLFVLIKLQKAFLSMTVKTLFRDSHQISLTLPPLVVETSYNMRQ